MLASPDSPLNLEVTFDDHDPHMQKLRTQERPRHFHCLSFRSLPAIKYLPENTPLQVFCRSFET